jgi:hypothetical protein
MRGLGIQLTKGVSEPAGIDVTHHVACRLLVQDRPAAADAFAVESSPSPPEEKRRRMLGLDDECFKPARGDDS